MESGINRPATIIVGLAIVIAAGVFTVWSLAPAEEPKTLPGLTEVTDPAEIQKMVELHNLFIVSSSNYLGHFVYTVKATLKNVSTMPIRLVDVKWTFVDRQKNVIKEERHTAFDPKQPPLEPGTEYQFEIPFENPPRQWNYIVPANVIVRVAY
jgi:methyl coenzyme M reductase subunit C